MLLGYAELVFSVSKWLTLAGIPTGTCRYFAKTIDGENSASI
jgi:hypothetical protein